ncbi:MAG: 2-oxoglutarate ferredoxin oxidoreductase subunit beta [Parcubacteria group bacterium GW2011_GWA2_43_9b]|nr:MAG: 2-oxoglutarate ferredoxin oxidoreductase subunit beta [Parcubacteria group bacterium GW2011_GWA2_43_9b]
MLYSDEVIKHFKNPGNMGKMANPDGRGEVGNPVCLLPKQNIHINNGIREIDKITAAEKILSADGRYSKIDKTTKRDYSGEVITIKNKLGNIRLTPDHLILAVKLPPGHKFLRTKNKKQLIPAWYHAEELRKGDIALYPILKEKNHLRYKTINISKSQWDFTSKKVPNKILINSDLLRLFGYFLSEGHVQDRPSRTFISFTLNIKENEIVNDIRKISKFFFNLDVAIRRLPERKTVVVDLYSARLARFFKEMFKNGAENKIIPDFIMNLSPERQKPLIYGLWKGDGCLNLKRAGARGGYVTISHELAQQIKILLLRQKIVPSIYIDKKKKIQGVNHKEAYRIHVGQRDSLIKLCSILGVKYIPRSYPSVDSWFDENFCYTPITQIKKFNYRGLVYNLEVPGSHSFTSEAFCLHNCGDMMNIDIKVGQNKKKQEIIKDIKFETLGCVAAIATSSMVTELAKGKTLDEALKIKYSDVADALGSLPPIKQHCADLAVKGLRAAIEDYRKNRK